jgi:hypothetical protein
LGLISRRGVRIGIGTSINTGFKAAIINKINAQKQNRHKQRRTPLSRDKGTLRDSA